MLGAETTARANVNVALVKYWGKRDRLPESPGHREHLADAGRPLGRGDLRLRRRRPRPTAPSTVTRPPDGRRVGSCASSTWSGPRRGIEARARRATTSSVPTGVGLASSAAAFASLAVARRAARRASPRAARHCRRWRRRGSGSAARSIFGGFVEWHRGERADGRDSIAEPLARARRLGRPDGRRGHQHGAARPCRRATGMRARGDVAALSRRGSRRPSATSPKRAARSRHATSRRSGSWPSTARSRCTRSVSPRARRSSTGAVRPSSASIACGRSAPKASAAASRSTPARR